MATQYSSEEIQYIHANAGNKKPAEIADHLKRSRDSIKVYMSKNGLLEKRKPFEFDKETEAYIIKHLNSKYMTDLAAELGVNYSKLYAFCIRKGLIYSKEKVTMLQAVTRKRKSIFIRPTAQYSNPDYSRKYI